MVEHNHANDTLHHSDCPRCRLNFAAPALLAALIEIRDAEAKCCPRCQGNGRLYADGQAHYFCEHAPTIMCGNCGGEGRLQPEHAQDIAARAIAEAEKGE